MAANTLIFPPIFEQVRSLAPAGTQIYLVGGAVRDALLNRENHDLDFVQAGDPRQYARQLANRLGAAYYTLDSQRHMGRVVLYTAEGKTYTLDFAPLEADGLESDLRHRDFSINAMAVALAEPQRLIDPLSGAADLAQKRLRISSPNSFSSDPVRVLRAVRMALQFNLRMTPETLAALRESVPHLNEASVERRRDELFRLVDSPYSASAVRLIDQFGALEAVLPGLSGLKDARQSPPHVYDVWTHTLDTLAQLQKLRAQLDPSDAGEAGNLMTGLLALRIGRYRQQIQTHMNQSINGLRTLWGLLGIAALYHDVGKPSTAAVDEHNRIRNIGHEKVSGELVVDRARWLQLSNPEIERLRLTVTHHMRVHLLAQTKSLPSRRAIYRYFKATGPTGIDVCLLSLADTLATYGPGLPVDVWQAELDVCRALFDAYWENPQESVHPQGLIDGSDLQRELGMKPGPALGRLLEAIREGQAVGEIDSRATALEFARAWLKDNEA